MAQPSFNSNRSNFAPTQSSFGNVGGSRPNMGGNTIRPAPNFSGTPGGNTFGRTIGTGNAINSNPAAIRGNPINQPNLGGNPFNRSNVGGNTINRPNVGGNTINRTDVGGNTFNRMNVGGNTINRTDVGGNTFNRTNVGGNTFNRTNVGGNTFNRTNVGNTINVNNTRIDNIANYNRPVNNNGGNNWGGGGGGWGGGGGYYPGYGGGGNWGYRPGWGYHSDWVNGYWHGNWNSSNWNWGSFAAGGLIGGLAGWGYGSSLWNMGYSPYYNPYYSTAPIVVQQPLIVQQFAASPYDYSQPINTTGLPPDDGTADAAVASFDDARTAFKQGDYPRALALTDQSLKSLPNDATAHEFRALCLFTLGQYDPAAASLYAILSVGPGWDWTTLIGLYADPNIYTTQLRALEAVVENNPAAAPTHFVLGYHYLTQGNTDAALNQYREVSRIQPSDKLSASLIQALGPKPAATAVAVANPVPVLADPAPPPNPQPDATAFPAPDVPALAGKWTAEPQPDVSIALTLKPENKFTWGVTQAGKSQSFDGEFTYGGDSMTLVQTAGPPLVGKLTWTDKDHFKFKIAGGPPGDPGLKFGR